MFGRKPTSTTYGNEPRTTPDINRGDRSAWKLPAAITRPEHRHHLDAYLLHVPQSHPLWFWYVATLIHLRPVAGEEQPVHKTSPSSTHEIMVTALNPERKLQKPRHWRRSAWLTPPDQAVQIEVNDDEQALQVFDAMIRHIVIDGASPDEDHRGYWHRSLVATAAHFRQGLH